MASKSFSLSCFFFVFALAMVARGAVATRSVAVIDPYVATTQDDSGGKVIFNKIIAGLKIVLLCFADGKPGGFLLPPNQAVHNANVTAFCADQRVVSAIYNPDTIRYELNLTYIEPKNLFKLDFIFWVSTCKVYMNVTQGVCGPPVPFASGDGLVQLESNIKLVKQSIVGDTLTGNFVTTGFAYKPEL